MKERCILAWNASVQGVHLYRKGIEPGSENTRLFRQKVVSYLSSQVIPKYSENEISEEQHHKDIDELIDYANSIGEKVLGQGRYKYEVAQKLLNLALKYYWCLGEITEPPHCPVDRIVIEMTRHKGTSWTKIVKSRSTRKLLKIIKHSAGTQSVAMWELSIYNRR